MPVGEDSFRYPKFVKIKETYPFGENRKDKFIDTHMHPRCYRNGDYPMPGYNPHLNRATAVNINIDRDDLILPKY